MLPSTWGRGVEVGRQRVSGEGDEWKGEGREQCTRTRLLESDSPRVLAQFCHLVTLGP